MPDAREMDALAATGEQVTAALTAMAIQAEGGKARSLLGHQVKILTDGAFTKARIKAIEGSKIFSTLDEGQIAVVAGFQGVDDEGQHHDARPRRLRHDARSRSPRRSAPTRARSTPTSTASTRPTRTSARRRARSRASRYEEMLELASLGAKVLQIRSVEIAMKYGVPVHVRSSFTDSRGHLGHGEDKALEDVVVTGVAYDKGEARVHARRRRRQARRRRPSSSARIAEKNISVDMIIQNVDHRRATGRADVTFTLAKTDLARAKPVIEEIGEGARRARGPLRRGHRQGLDRRPRHALARRHRREDVPHPRERGHQHPGDLDERDQGLRASSPRSTPSSPCARCTTASASPRPERIRAFVQSGAHVGARFCTRRACGARESAETRVGARAAMARRDFRHMSGSGARRTMACRWRDS